MSEKVRRYDDLIIEYMLENLPLEKELVISLVHKSSVMEILKEDEEFIGHYPPDYWVEYILNEWNDILKQTTETLKRIKI
ncbi:hypothetical protein [Paenibacillus silvae]|uniref:Uncharacterized protein n=1 Tax=Paenibacillus silvae TaxID=1325358 RepID=A0A2W6NQ60_9BACL|nr:hypothetical protein [Paenibacillus silvae]PZT57398.1 hypothetical protein DN757_01710 [Paenibacillus silvae]